jgi:hypothetical protein
MGIRSKAALKVALGVALLTVAIAPASPASTVSKDKVAYVFKGDTAAKESFKELLTNKGYEFRAVKLDEVSDFDFAGTDVVVVAADTNDGYADFASGEAIDILDGIKKPILAVGIGGSMLLDHIVPDMGYSISANGTAGRVSVAAGRDDVWSQPLAVDEGIGEDVKLFTEAQDFTAIWDDAMGSDVRAIGSKVYQTQDRTHSYHALARGDSDDGQHLFLWGFNGSASEMTWKGRRLFVNSIERVQGSIGR